MRKDIDLNFNPHPLTKDLVTLKGTQATIQAMKNLVLTNYYERGFNVEVYSNVKASLFENDIPSLRSILETNIKRVLKNFEPNVEVLEVMIDGYDDNTIDVRIFYNEYYNPERKSFVVNLERLR